MKFYTVDTNYIHFLKQLDNQIPNFSYTTHNKFVCGVILNIDGIDFYAPISHFKKAQRTNFPIKDKGEIISTVRLCFMFPAPKQVLTQLDFSKVRIVDSKYADLLATEYRYLKSHLKELEERAQKVYRIGINKSHPLNYTCCDFLKLQANYLDFNKNIDYSKELPVK